MKVKLFLITALASFSHAFPATDTVFGSSSTVTDATDTAMARNEYHGLARRALVIQPDYAKEELQLNSAMINCKFLAEAAARAAVNNPTKLKVFFKYIHSNLR